MPVCRLPFVEAYLKNMKTFHFPKHVLLLFLVLLAVVFFSFGAASYIVSIETQNEEAVVAREIVGDWVVLSCRYFRTIWSGRAGENAFLRSE